MAEKQASYIQASSHPADTDRLVLEGLMNPAGAPVSGALYGVGQASGDLAVAQNGTPNMSVNVAAGHVWIDGTESATQGVYHGYNDATKNLVIAASDPTNARKDLVVAKVQDAAYSGATNAWTLAVVTGTPSGAPVEPAVPANAVVLAVVAVAALATTITNANITDRRRRAVALGGVGVCTSASRPTSPYVGQTIIESDTFRMMIWNGTDWAPYGAGGQLQNGYAQVTATQGTFTAETDLTSLTVTVTVATNRRVRISALTHPQSSVAADDVVVRIKEGGTSFEEGVFPLPVSTRTFNAYVTAVITPTAGAHTYKVSMARIDGSGNISNVASGTQKGYILAEDIGPA